MKTRSLRTKLLFQYLALVLICMVVIPALISLQIHKQFYKYSSEKLTEDEQQIISLVEKSLVAGNNDGKNFQGEMLNWPVTRFTVTNKEGQSLFTVKHTPRKVAPNQAERDKQIEKLLTVQKFALHSANKEKIGEITFYIVPFKISREGRFMQVFQRDMYAGVAVMLLFAVIFAMFMTRKIVRPLLKTAEQAKKISEGSYIAEKHEQSDIKEIQMLLDSVDRLGTELAEQEELRKRLMSDIAHELRNPVTVVKAQLEAFADGVWEPTAERLQLTLTEIDRLSLLIKEVEGLTTLAKGYETLSISVTDLSQLTKKSALSFEPLFKNKGVELKLDIEEGLELAIDPARIRQAVENLVSNALRYTDKGGSVKVSLARSDKRVTLSVADTGIGMAKEELPHIFERFYRTDKSRTRASGGMGIGLAIVKAIIEAHGATITAQSEEGKGSCFTVTFQTKE